MDGFSYTDIFATKGIEYLVVITFLTLLVPFWLMLNKQSGMGQQIRSALGNLSFKMLKIPQGLLYSKNHTWMYMEKSGVAKVGLDDLLLHLTGGVKCIFQGNEGNMVQRGDLFIELQQDGKLLKILSPVSGQIAEINPALLNNPEVVNNDPYGKGWIYKIKPSDWVSEVKHCLFAQEASDWTTNELERVKEFLALSVKNFSPESSMAILQDGGELCDHTLAALPDPIWRDFEKEFLELT